MNRKMVSVFCLAYNHENYIRDALEGFVNQKTNFEYEVLINDDCSTDNTASIIKEYELKYPNIIKPIYQTENQYSKHVGIIKNILLPKAQGKYIALCEGDDCWIDENKLQMQVDYMEANADCTFCFTNAIFNDLEKNTKEDFIYTNNNTEYINDKKNNKYNLGEMVKMDFIPTATFFYPRCNYDKFPLEFNEYCPGGDRKISLYSTLIGYAHFINKSTSLYRYNVPNSAMSTWKHYDNEKKYYHYLSFINLHNNLNKCSNYLYKEEINEYNKKWKLWLLLTGYDKKLLKDDEYVIIRNDASLKNKIKIFLAYHMPHIYNLLKKFKNE